MGDTDIHHSPQKPLSSLIEAFINEAASMGYKPSEIVFSRKTCARDQVNVEQVGLTAVQTAVVMLSGVVISYDD